MDGNLPYNQRASFIVNLRADTPQAPNSTRQLTPARRQETPNGDNCIDI